MKLKRFMFILICLLVGAAMAGCSPNLPSESSSGLVVQLTLEQLAAKADSILVGKVTNITCYQEGKGNIYTLVTLSVEQTIKGEPVGEVVIRVPGGKVGELEMMVTDTPSFQLGERAVVFLDKGDGTFTVVGGFQGKFTVDNNNMVGNKPLTEFIDQIKDVLTR
jgi:hypothetical protein